MTEKDKKKTREWNLAFLKRIFRMSKQPKECILTTVKLANGLDNEYSDFIKRAEQTDEVGTTMLDRGEDETPKTRLAIVSESAGEPTSGK